MTTGDQNPRAELTDEQLDALLKSADQELLDYIQARTDPTAVLAQVMASSDAARDTLPLRNPTFTGRALALEDLERRLVAQPVAIVPTRGQGGVGKSQLALEYAHRMRQAGRYELAAWVRAESLVTVAEDLAALAPLLGLPVQAAVGETAAKVVGALGSRRGWLVVYDNAQQPSDLAGMLPRGGGHVLINSRNPVWGDIAAQMELGEFSRSESVEFVEELSGSNEPEAARELADELGDLPLALAQAAACIVARSMTIGGYLEAYRDPLLARRLRGVDLEAAKYPASVARTWLLSFRQLSGEHPAAVELLRLCAFLDPDDVDLDLLSAGRAEAGDALARVLGDRQERNATVGALEATSLVTVPAEGHLRVHRLVQAVTRDQLDNDQAAQWAMRALNLVKAILLPSEPDDYRSWPVYTRLAPHIDAVAGLPSSYPIPAEERIILLKKLGVYLSASGQLKASRAIFQRGLDISQAAYGPGHSETAKALDNLGGTQLRLGELRDARGSIERALAIFQAAYGPDDPEVAKALGNLSIVQRQLWELKDARASIERALAIFQAIHGPDHSEVAKAFIDLGKVQMGLGKLEDARTSLEHGLAISEMADRPDEPEIAEGLAGLGAVQLRQGELKEARTSLERAVAISEEVYGPDNPEVARVLIRLAALQLRQGEIGEACGTLERALPVLQGTYGPDHHEVASALVYLGAIQLDLGELGDARISLERALAIRKAVYGPDHPSVASALVNLGVVQLRLGEPGDARSSLERALAINEAVYGLDHLEVAKALTGLGVVQFRLKRRRDCRASLKRAVAIMETAYGSDYGKITKTVIDLGVVRQERIAKYVIYIFLVLTSPMRKISRLILAL